MTGILPTSLRPALYPVVAFLTLGGADAASAQGSPALAGYLARVGIDDRQRAAAARGRAVAKLLPTRDNRDVTVVGVVGIDAPVDSIVARALDAERFLAVHNTRFHVFADPPSLEDVSGVAFDASEYRGLRKCRSGDCDFKLAQSEMKTFAERVDWASSDAKAQADARLRGDLLRLVTDYVARGNAAMPTYDDAAGSVKSADAFEALLAQTTDLYENPPELQRYLSTYPAERPEGAHDFLYWSDDHLPHLRPTLTVNHLVVYAPPARRSSAAFIARKQLYANHYFEGAFELLAVVGASDGAADAAAYLVTVRRFRFDALPGGVFNIRGRVRRGLVEATRVDLDRQRASLRSR